MPWRDMIIRQTVAIESKQIADTEPPIICQWPWPWQISGIAVHILTIQFVLWLVSVIVKPNGVDSNTQGSTLANSPGCLLSKSIQKVVSAAQHQLGPSPQNADRARWPEGHRSREENIIKREGDWEADQSMHACPSGFDQILPVKCPRPNPCVTGIPRGSDPLIMHAWTHGHWEGCQARL